MVVRAALHVVSQSVRHQSINTCNGGMQHYRYHFAQPRAQELLKDPSGVGRRVLDTWPQYRGRLRQDAAGRPQVRQPPRWAGGGAREALTRGSGRAGLG